MSGNTERTATPSAWAAWDFYPANTPRQLYHNLAEQALIQADALPQGDDEAYMQTLDAAHLAVETVLVLLRIPNTWQPILDRALGQATPGESHA